MRTMNRTGYACRGDTNRQHSMAALMISGLPVQSKLKSTPPSVISLMIAAMGFSTPDVFRLSVSPKSLPATLQPLSSFRFRSSCNLWVHEQCERGQIQIWLLVPFSSLLSSLSMPMMRDAPAILAPSTTCVQAHQRTTHVRTNASVIIKSSRKDCWYSINSMI